MLASGYHMVDSGGILLLWLLECILCHALTSLCCRKFFVRDLPWL